MKRSLIAICLSIAAATSVHAAENTCRRFLPATGVVIQVSCLENVAYSSNPAPAAVNAPQGVPTATAAPAEAAKPAIAPSVHKPAPAATAQVVTMKTCVEILERAQSGKLLGGDVEILRGKCRSVN